MRKLRDNWLALVILAGIIFAVAISTSTNHSENQQTRQNQVAGCMRTGVTKALDANFAIRAAAARRADGNPSAARYYEGVGDGIILTIPAATPELQGSRRMAAVELKHINGRDRYVLTPVAAKLQREGCQRVNGV